VVNPQAKNLVPFFGAAANPVEIQGGGGGDVILTLLREEVVTSLKGVNLKEVLRWRE
jgi:centromeric protein E